MGRWKRSSSLRCRETVRLAPTSLLARRFTQPSAAPSAEPCGIVRAATAYHRYVGAAYAERPCCFARPPGACVCASERLQRSAARAGGGMCQSGHLKHGLAAVRVGNGAEQAFTPCSKAVPSPIKSPGSMPRAFTAPASMALLMKRYVRDSTPNSWPCGQTVKATVQRRCRRCDWGLPCTTSRHSCSSCCSDRRS